MTHYAGGVVGPWPAHLTWFKWLLILMLVAIWASLLIKRRLSRSVKPEFVMLVASTAICAGYVADNAALFDVGIAVYVGAFAYSYIRNSRKLDRASVLRALSHSKPPAEVVMGSEPAGDDSRDITLLDTGPQVIRVVNELRRMYCLGLREAVFIVDHPPMPLRERVTPAEADYVRSRLEALDASVSVGRSGPRTG